MIPFWGAACPFLERKSLWSESLSDVLRFNESELLSTRITIHQKHLRVIQRILSAPCQVVELKSVRIGKIGVMNDEKDAPSVKIDDIDDEVAVALTYKPGQDQAPRVVAKGQGWLARQIIEIAEANGIEIREDANLAQILAQVDVDSEIPLEAFTVVAEILSYVYEKNKQWPSGLGPQK